MPDPRRDTGLRTIFSFFLGLMLTAFVGVGVYTFHGPPQQHEAQIRDLNRQQAALRSAKAGAALTPAEQAQIQEMESRRTALADSASEARKPWGRSTSMILIVFATLIMAVSLVRADELPVITNGLLLGGLFTMLYGVGWILSTDTSVTRFLVMTAALLITLSLGYARFVRRRAAATAPSVDTGGGEDLDAIEARLRNLEERMNDAARALSHT